MAKKFFNLARDAKKEFEKVAQKDKNNTFKFSSNILLKDKIHIISIEKPLVLMEKAFKKSKRFKYLKMVRMNKF